jgi:hypothetical protein
MKKMAKTQHYKIYPIEADIYIYVYHVYDTYAQNGAAT